MEQHKPVFQILLNDVRKKIYGNHYEIQMIKDRLKNTITEFSERANTRKQEIIYVKKETNMEKMKQWMDGINVDEIAGLVNGFESVDTVNSTINHFIGDIDDTISKANDEEVINKIHVNNLISELKIKKDSLINIKNSKCKDLGKKQVVILNDAKLKDKNKRIIRNKITMQEHIIASIKEDSNPEELNTASVTISRDNDILRQEIVTIGLHRDVRGGDFIRTSLLNQATLLDIKFMERVQTIKESQAMNNRIFNNKIHANLSEVRRKVSNLNNFNADSEVVESMNDIEYQLQHIINMAIVNKDQNPNDLAGYSNEIDVLRVNTKKNGNIRRTEIKNDIDNSIQRKQKELDIHVQNLDELSKNPLDSNASHDNITVYQNKQKISNDLKLSLEKEIRELKSNKLDTELNEVGASLLSLLT